MRVGEGQREKILRLPLDMALHLTTHEIMT